jgi:hypothetical protein
MPDDISPLGPEEFRALRATIRERGTTRLVVGAITFVSWGALAIGVPAVVAVPVLGLIPLLVLAAGFEVVFAAHVGVERVGRFIQARYEDESRPVPGWERAAMQAGRSLPGAGIDPLFSGLFTAAAMLNLAPIALLSVEGGPTIGGGVPLELAVYGMLHAVFIGRIIYARRYAAGQRERDLAFFSGSRKKDT